MTNTKKELDALRSEKRRLEKIAEAGVNLRMNPATRTEMYQAIGLHFEFNVQVDLGWHETEAEAKKALEAYDGK